jgi:hypothetical protein
MIQPTEMKTLDRAGIDLLVWSDDFKFPWAVQCKGFKEVDLGESQIKQILASIRKFANSPYSCDHYVLLHNRTSQNREATKLIRESLAHLLQSGKASTVHLWDRQKFIVEVQSRLRGLILERMQSDAISALQQHEAIFRFGSVYIPIVPVSEKRVVMRRGERMRLEDTGGPIDLTPISQRIIAPVGARWTMLTGPFGTGKTTTVLHAAQMAGHQIIYVRAEAMTDRGPGIGTNAMLGRSADAMRLFDDYDDQTRVMAERLAGQTLAAILRGRDASFVLVIDGLDENRKYGKPNGLMQLTNDLAELTCPIILTTRREHFDSVRSNFERAFEDLSIKTGAKRDGRLLDLGIWTDREIEKFIAQAIGHANPQEARHLRLLADGIKSGELYRLYGDLPAHPLFLQMILEDAARGQIAKRNRAELVRDWMEQKIRRDLRGCRETPAEVVDVDTFVAQMMELHEKIASAMIEFQDGAWSLTEEIGSDVVVENARRILGTTNIDISTILGCSVLSAVSPRTRGLMPIKFLLRVCQEFFLSLSLHNAGEQPDGYPAPVVGFWTDLACRSASAT